jgi:hypothetical protein
MNKKPALAFILFATLLVIGFENCGSGADLRKGLSLFGSTTSGNPMNPTNQMAEKVLNAVCLKMLSCEEYYEGLTFEECVSGFAATSRVSQSIGLPTGVFGTYQAIIDAERSGSITADRNAAENCLADVYEQSCKKIRGCWNPTLSDPFANVGIAIPKRQDSCPNLFNPAAVISTDSKKGDDDGDDE